jgi:hypothetical protein
MEGAMADLTPDAQAAFERWQDIKNWSDYVNVAEYARAAFLAGHASLVDASDRQAEQLWHGSCVYNGAGDAVFSFEKFREALAAAGLRLVVGDGA